MMDMNHTTRRAVLCGVTAMALSTSACAQEREQSSASYPVFTSLEQLVAASSDIATGRVTSAGRPALDGDIPVALFTFEIDRRAKGGPDSTLTLVMPDTSSARRRREKSVVPNQEYLLFLTAVTEQSRDGLKGRGTLYATAGGPGGIFTVAGDRAHPVQAPDLKTLSDGGQPLPTADGASYLPLTAVFA